MSDARQKAALRNSIELEKQADLMAAGLNLTQAVILMKEANRIRRSVFGRLDPNQLRDRTHDLLKEASVHV